jgi:lysophospholipase L1-like esterase
MPTILCFGDSNTWGFDPDATARSPFPVRHPPGVRWTGVLVRELGDGFRVVEEGQNGRTTVHDDPFTPARNGRDVLPALLESHKPLDGVVMMLGTNDLKAVFNAPPGEVAAGVAVLARMILRSDAGVGARPPKLLLVCPPAVGPLGPHGDLAEKFPDGQARSRRLPALYRRVADELGVPLLDAQPLVTGSAADPLHFDAANHETLGRAVAGRVVELLR